MAIIVYLVNPFRHLCSSTSAGHIVKSDSSRSMCERVFSILSLIGTVSCRWVSQRIDLSKGMSPDIVNSRDGL